MPKATQLSEFERGEIIGLRKANFTYVQIAEILKRSKTAVQNTIKDYFKENKTSTASRPGRPKKLTVNDSRQVLKITIIEICNELKESNIKVKKP